MNSTNETTTTLELETTLPIRAVSGGERGMKDSGKKHDYLLPKAAWMALAGEVFDLEVKASNSDNAKSGGAVSQFLHSYGATADKQEKSGIEPFPGQGQTFNGDNMESWLEVMEFKAPRTGGNRKSAKDITIEAILVTLNVPGITWSMLKGAYAGITLEDIEAYKAKQSAKTGE